MLEKARYTSSVRRINQRIQKVAETFGTGSGAYQSLIDRVRTLSPQQAQYYNKNNILQLTQKQLSSQDVLNKIEELDYTKDLLDKAREELSDFPKEFGVPSDVTREEMIDYINTTADFDRLTDEIIPALYGIDNEIAKRGIEIAKLGGRRKSTEELADIVNAYYRSGANI